MSTQRGNTSRIRRQKHQNRTVFNNSLHDTSKHTKMLNNLEIAEVCKRCQEVIAWKIKYKKYKALSQPKTCTGCRQKTIKERLQTMAQLEMEVKALSERRRRAYYRYIDKLEGKKKKKKNAKQQDTGSLETERVNKESAENEEETCEEPTPLSLEEYFRNARQKLEELKKGMTADDDLFDDLSISSDEEEDDFEDGDE
ncbi:uncharacterized protein LOC121871236 isoform X2 [Homarus americanus]|uniref:uncharacterized protein LOC121871236 isoform X2 n=1 Tax=Homarus americanus TaxID=6706 RepID=UPI001C479496|nr:uncharacterized protein LOC121871236 isoform X2 [Homarus americanus]